MRDDELRGSDAFDYYEIPILHGLIPAWEKYWKLPYGQALLVSYS
jgi:hypothetical protein